LWRPQGKDTHAEADFSKYLQIFPNGKDAPDKKIADLKARRPPPHFSKLTEAEPAKWQDNGTRILRVIPGREAPGPWARASC